MTRTIHNARDRIIDTTRSMAALDDRVRDAVSVVLGSTEPRAFWGQTFDSFQHRFTEALVQHQIHPCQFLTPGHANLPPAGVLLSKDDLLARLDGSDGAAGITAEYAESVMATVKVLGVAGPIGSGKDTLADHLVQTRGYIKVSFADVMRATASLLYQMPACYFEDRILKDAPLAVLGGRSPRRVLQLLGTEVGRSIREDIWVHRLHLSIAARVRPEGARQVVIPDVRFPDEADSVRESGRNSGRLARIWCPSAGAAASSAAAGHSSEAGLPAHPSDIFLRNEGTLPEYLEGAERVLQEAAVLTELPSRQPRRNTLA